MKAGLALAAHVFAWLRGSGAELRRPLALALSADEELGSREAHERMERLVPPDATALVLEPPLPDGSLKAWRKGVGMYRLEARGREAHAGNEPERGVNAIVELARRILELEAWGDAARGITVNVGEVHGGVATNVVAGRAWAGVDTRFDGMEDGVALDRRLRALAASTPGASLHLEGGLIFPPMCPSVRGRGLIDLACRVARELGLEVGAGRSGGGSDGSFLAARGALVLDGLGVDGAGAHAPDEHIRIDRIAPRAAFLARLILALQDE
jgi:glutamate carboxypeptidase